MSAALTVNVSGLASTTTKEVLEHFFSFCGKIDHVDQEGTTAKITFVKESACKTALMLNGGTLESSTISVTSDHIEAPAAASATAPPSSTSTSHAAEHGREGSEVEQEDKPHSAKVAELLASGYMLSDAAIKKAIDADHQYGISARFLSFFNPVAEKVQATAQPHLETATSKLGELDATHGVSLKAQAAAIIGTKYYNSALASPFGSKVHSFYTNTTKQVLDVHEEALRIKGSRTQSTSTSTTTPATPATGTSVDSAVGAAKAETEKVV